MSDQENNNNLKKLLSTGLDYVQASEFLEAEKFFVNAIKIDPLNFDALYLLGITYASQNRPKSAESMFRKALEINKSHADANFNLGIILEKIGQENEAIELYDSAAKINPNFFEALYNKANLLAKRGDLTKSLEAINKVIGINPNFQEAIENKVLISKLIDEQSKNHAFSESYQSGINLLKENSFEQALCQFNVAISINNKKAEGYHGRAMAQEKLGRLENALLSYNQALFIDADSAETLNNKGNVLRELGRGIEALKCFEESIKLKPENATTYNNLGWTYYELNKFNEAINAFNTSISLDATLPDPKFNLSLCQLMLGHYSEGWINYEYRKKLKSHNPILFSKPKWLGVESLRNKTIYIYCEQGLGDTIQFCRYLKLLENQGATVIFEPQPLLAQLLKNIEGVSHVVKSGENIPDYDFHTSLMSLPLAFNTTEKSIPNSSAYIYANKDKTMRWCKKLEGIKGLKVGLVWSGGFRPDQPELWPVNERRNIPFKKICELNLPNISFFSLQKGKEAEEELAIFQEQHWKGNNLYNFTSELHDFTDTAALIQNLDLVISVDTSTAHLAAALGKPTWILNRLNSCWRWKSEGAKTSWYESVKLYRQSIAGDWDSVLSDVQKDLLKLVVTQ